MHRAKNAMADGGSGGEVGRGRRWSRTRRSENTLRRAAGREDGRPDMRYTKLGSTGLDVSVICLGCMSYGEPGRGGHPWSLDEDASRPFYRAAMDAGINFYDTAN